MAQTVLDDDDRAVDDQAKIERAEAHQVTGDARMNHAGNGHQHGQRDHRSRDQCSTPVAEQQEQHCDHQQRTFSQIFFDRRDGLIDQRGAVIERRQHNVLRKRWLDAFQALGGGTSDLPTVLANQHEHGAEYDFLAVLGRRTGTQLVAQADISHIMNSDRHPLAFCNRDLF